MQTWAKSFKKRDPAIDILKGIAIILMVYAHAFPWCIYFLRLYIPMIFLVVSGYCQKSHIASFSEWKRFMLGKVKSIYVPCAVCNGIFALLGGLFLRIHFYTDDPAFLEMTKSWPYPQKLYTVNGIGEILTKFVKCVLMMDTTQLGNATWFLIVMFGICLMYSTFQLLISKLPERHRQLLKYAMFAVCVIVGQLLDPSVTAMRFVRCQIYCLIGFLIGVWFKHHEHPYFYTPFTTGLAVFVIAVVSQLHPFDLANANEPVHIAFISAMADWIFMYPLSHAVLFYSRISRALQYVGKHTLSILCLHMIGFKVVSLMLLKVRELPIIYLASFHTIIDASQLWKLLYAAYGVLLPLALSAAWSWFAGRTFRRAGKQKA